MDDEQDIDLEAIAARIASELAASRERRMGLFAVVREMRRQPRRAKETDGDN